MGPSQLRYKYLNILLLLLAFTISYNVTAKGRLEKMKKKMRERFEKFKKLKMEKMEKEKLYKEAMINRTKEALINKAKEYYAKVLYPNGTMLYPNGTRKETNKTPWILNGRNPNGTMVTGKWTNWKERIQNKIAKMKKIHAKVAKSGRNPNGTKVMGKLSSWKEKMQSKIAKMKQMAKNFGSGRNMARNITVALKDFNDMLVSHVSLSKVYDDRGSIDAAVWKNGDKGDMIPLYQKAFGMAQSTYAKMNFSGSLPSKQLKVVADRLKEIEELSLNVPALNDTSKGRNIYRIASNTKSFIGVAAMYMSKKLGLDLDDKIHKYVDLSSLGIAHNWNKPTKENGYISDKFPNASSYAKNITFRHLLQHTSGLSREVLKGDQYSYGSSRTNTPICPPFSNLSICDPKVSERNWEAWTWHILQYMMPSCGYEPYPEKSNRTSCVAGEYYHYSNAAYSLLALAMDRFLKGIDKSYDLENWMVDNIFDKLDLDDTAFTWVDLDEEQKNRVANGVGGSKETETDFITPVTDFADHGFKTPPGGIWSTTTDLAKFYLGLDQLKLGDNVLRSSTEARLDKASEEDPSQMPTESFSYGHGFYNAPNYMCYPGMPTSYLMGAWGTVPGYTSYVITNLKQESRPEVSQYVVVLLRNYNYAGNLNLGVEARKLLCQIIHA